MALDRKKLAVIHIVKRELGLADDAYRDILQRETGIGSAKDLDEKGFRSFESLKNILKHKRLSHAQLDLLPYLF